MNVPFDNQSIAPPGNHSTEPGLTMMDALIPAPALPLLLLLMLILPMALLAAQSLFIPLFESFMAMFMSGSDGVYATLPWSFYVKLGAFLLLSFFGLFQLILRIKTYYYSVWAQRFPKPHPLHVHYQPDNQQSILALLNWSLYRTFSIFGPPIILAVLTAGLGILEIYLFNFFSALPISLPIQFIIALFLFMLLSLFTVFSCLNSVWAFFTTIFGDVISVTEPDLASKTVYERCGRIAFSSPMVYILYPAYFLLVAGVLFEIYLLLSRYTIQNLISFQIDIPLILGTEAATIGLYILLCYFKFSTYHHALVTYYNKLPLEFKDRFAAQQRSLY